MGKSIDKPLNVLLGYPEDQKLLIINCDDAGMSHSVNMAVEKTMEFGLAKSATIMVPCPWFPEFAAIMKRHPEFHAGIHLTLNCEWEFYKWGPVCDRCEVPSLVDERGYLWETESQVLQNAKLDEVEKEFRAQVQRAINFGINPTHIDAHMGHYHFSDQMFEVAYKIAREFGITMRVAFHHRRDRLRKEGMAVIDWLWFDTYDPPVNEREDFYVNILKQMLPGVNELVIHAGFANEELEAITESWQRRNFDREFFTSEKAKKLLKDLNIIPIGYYDLLNLQRELVKGE